MLPKHRFTPTNKVKAETPTASEALPVQDWVVHKVAKDPKSRILASEQDTLILHADDFVETTDDDKTLGPLCTADGVYAEWVVEGEYTILRCYKDGKRFTPLTPQRPKLLCAHDEVIVRHKDVGRVDWSHPRMCSQVWLGKNVKRYVY